MERLEVQKEMTNGDKIRSMTDKELAYYITSKQLYVCKNFLRYAFLNVAPDQEFIKLYAILSSEFDPDEFRCLINFKKEVGL